MTIQQLDETMSFCVDYHLDRELFWTFDVMIEMAPLASPVPTWVDRFSPLVFSILKKFPPGDSQRLVPEIAHMGDMIVRNVIRSANGLGIASLVALEKLALSICDISMSGYLDLLMLTAQSVRSSNLVQEILLVLNDSRAPSIAQSDLFAYIHKHALAISFDRAEEAADECPCNDLGIPRKSSSAVPILKLLLAADGAATVIAHVRIDTPNPVRLHSHVRLQAAAEPEKGWVQNPLLDGIVVQAARGELKIELYHPPPPELERMQWRMYDAGSVGKLLRTVDELVLISDLKQRPER